MADIAPYNSCTVTDNGSQIIYQYCIIFFVSALETLKTRCQTLAASGDTTKVKEIDVTIADFDGCLYHISNPEEGNTSVIQISIQLQYWHQLEQHDVNEFLKQEYGDYFTAPEANYNASIVVDLTTIASNPDATIEKFARLKRNAFAGVFAKYFRIQQGGIGVSS